MPRSVNAVASRARRKKVLKQTKGNYGNRNNVWTVAKNTYEKGLQYAYRDRKAKKRTFRALWIQRINAAARLEGMSYSQLMGGLKKAFVDIDRKALAYLAVEHPEAFKAVVQTAKDGLAGKVKKVEATVATEKPAAKKAPAKKAEAKEEKPAAKKPAAKKPAAKKAPAKAKADAKPAAKKAPAKKPAAKKAAPKAKKDEPKAEKE